LKFLLRGLEQPLLGCDQIDETLNADSSLSYFLSQRFDRDSIHAATVAKRPRISCASSPDFPKIPAAPQRQVAQARGCGVRQHSAYN